MRAAWYEHQGDPYHSLVVGEMPDPAPGAGEVRIAMTVSGLSPGDVKKRSGWQGSTMSYPRVIPHSDGAGTIDAVGPGADQDRIGERMWCYGAQSYRPFGTAAEYVVVPSDLAVPLTASTATPPPPGDLDAQASCLGIAGITAHRAVFADGPVDGLTVLIHGAVGGVGSIATRLARRDGANVLAVVLNDHQICQALQLGAHHAFRDDDPGLARRIAGVAPQGVHRIAEVDFAGPSTSTPPSSLSAASSARTQHQAITPPSPTGHSASKTPPCACSEATSSRPPSKPTQPAPSPKPCSTAASAPTSPPATPSTRSPTPTPPSKPEPAAES